jgi:hypothetical protein
LWGAHPRVEAYLCCALALPAAAHTVTARASLAEVNGEPITAEEVDKALGAALGKLEQQLYEMKRQKVEALIGERLLAWEAARRNISVQALLDTEVRSQVGLVTEQEIETLYQANKAHAPTPARRS